MIATQISHLRVRGVGGAESNEVCGFFGKRGQRSGEARACCLRRHKRDCPNLSLRLVPPFPVPVPVPSLALAAASLSLAAKSDAAAAAFAAVEERAAAAAATT